MLTDFNDPITVGIVLDIANTFISDEIKKILVQLAVDIEQEGIVCVSTATEPPQDQGSSVGWIASYTPPLVRKPHQVEDDFKRTLAMVSEYESSDKYLFFITDSYKSTDFHRIQKCCKQAERSDYDFHLCFFGLGSVDVPDLWECASYYLDTVADLGESIRQIVLGPNNGR